MKIIKYKVCAKINHGTEEESVWEEVLTPVEIICYTKAQYEANLLIAEKEAVPGTLDPDPVGEFEPVSDELTDAKRIAELEEMLNALLGVAE